MAKDTYIPRDELVDMHKEFNKIRKKAEKELMALSGVLAVGVGLKEIKGELQRELCFKVTVLNKKAKRSIKVKDRIPEEIFGFKTDVNEIKTSFEQADTTTEHLDTSKYRPLVGGCQIDTSVWGRPPGTLGCLAKRNIDGKIVALSNWHVIMSNVNGLNGERIGQPEHNGCCSCCACNEIGSVVDGEYSTNMDAAIVLLDGQDADTIPKHRYVNEILEIGIIAGSEPCLSGETVFKYGRTSKKTQGQIINDNAAYETSSSVFNTTFNRVGIIKINPTPPPDSTILKFMKGGDSGSVLVNEHNKVIGLLYSSDFAPPYHAGAFHIAPILERLKITILDSTFPSTANKTGVPLSAVAGTPPSMSLQETLSQLEGELSKYKEGQRIFDLFKVHRIELLELVRTNREVMAAWHRYQGPAYLAHIARSIRRENKPVPDRIKGVSLQNLLLKMTTVLQRNGSVQLSKTVNENYLNIAQILSHGKSLEDWKENLADLSNPINLHLT